MDTQTQIDRLIELAIVQRSDLKKLVSELPQLREHLNAEIERVFETTEPQLRIELEDWTTKQTKDQTAKLGDELEAKIVALSKSLEATTQTRYNAIMAERAENLNLLAKAEARIEDAAAMLSGAVKEIVTDELSRFPRAGEIDQLRKEFAEPRGLNPRGRWEPGATYYKLDLVAYNGDSYVANEETSEKPNRNSSKWTLNAARGQAGGGGFMSPAIGDYTASMITNVPAGTIAATNVQDAINELAADVDVSQNTLDALVTNAESVAITKGQVVYAFGATGNRMSVKLALNTGDATSAKTIGVVLDSSIAAGATGNIRCVGVVDGLTLGSYTEGNTVYLGATAGSITATKPYAPNHLVYVGIVERANNGNGELYVKIQNGYELDEIHDVQITSAPLAGALLMRDATNSLWKANRLTGTANQVTVTNADTAVTLSLPTSLASVDSVTASASTALTLTGGSSGASLVLGQGTAAADVTLAYKGTGKVAFNRWVAASATAPAALAAGSGGIYFQANGSVAGTQDSWVFDTGYTDQSYRFKIAGTDKMVIAANTGNLLIGTTTDMSGSGGLKVAGTTAATTTTSGALIVAGGVGVSGAGYFGGVVSAAGGLTAGTQIQATAGAAVNLQNAASDAQANILNTGSAGSSIIDFRTASTSRLTIGAAGVINITNTTSASSSTVGALTIGNGTAATNVAIGGGFINAGQSITAGGSIFTSSSFYVPSGNRLFFDYGVSNSYYAYKNGTTLELGAVSAVNVAIATEATTSAGVGALTTAGGIHAAKRIVSDSTEASTGSTSGSGIFAGGIYAGAASVFGSTVTVSAGFAEIAIRSTSDAAAQRQYLTFGSTTYNRAQFQGVSSGTSDGSLELRTFNAGTQTLSQTWNKDGSSTFAGAVTMSESSIVTRSQNGTTSFGIRNANGGTASVSALYVGNDTSNTRGSLFTFGTGYTTSNQYVAGSVLLESSDTAGLGISGTNSGPVKIWNNAGVTATFTATGTTFASIIKPQQATTAGAPAYVKGAIYFDTTLNKLRVGGATAWETITSV